MPDLYIVYVRLNINVTNDVCTRGFSSWVLCPSLVSNIQARRILQANRAEIAKHKKKLHNICFCDLAMIEKPRLYPSSIPVYSDFR